MNIYGLSYEVTTANRKTFFSFFFFILQLEWDLLFYRREEHVKENVNFPALS